jgi:hypothetical protein
MESKTSEAFEETTLINVNCHALSGYDRKACLFKVKRDVIASVLIRVLLYLNGT